MHEQDQQHAQQEAGAGLAPQACASCRKQKRRCDKQLPACSLCQRIGRICDYRPDAQAASGLPSPEDFVALQQQVANLETLLRSSVASPPGSNGHSSSNGSQNISSANSPANGGLLSSSGCQPNWQPPSTFPSLYFLDSNAFMYEKFQVRRRSSSSTSQDFPL